MGKRGDAVRRKLLGLSTRNVRKVTRKREVLSKRGRGYVVKTQYDTVEEAESINPAVARKITECLGQTRKRISDIDLSFLWRMDRFHVRPKKPIKDKADVAQVNYLHEKYVVIPKRRVNVV